MKFIDHAKISVKSGKGGDGCIAFLREKFRPKVVHLEAMVAIHEVVLFLFPIQNLLHYKTIHIKNNILQSQVKMAKVRICMVKMLRI